MISAKQLCSAGDGVVYPLFYTDSVVFSYQRSEEGVGIKWIAGY